MPITAAQLTAMVEAFPWDEWGRKHLAPGYRQIYRDLVDVTGKRAATTVGGAWSHKDPFTSRFMTDYVGERITQLQGTSKERVIALVRKTLDDGAGQTGRRPGRRLRTALDHPEIWPLRHGFRKP